MRYIINCDPRLEIEKPYELIAAPEIVFFSGEINEETAAIFRRDVEISEMNAIAAGQKILPVCIDSVGGCLYSLMGMIDSMNACTVKLATVIEAKAMSAAAVLAVCGDPEYRYMGPNATVMIHSASGMSHGTVEEVENDTKELKRLYSVALELIAKHSGHKKSFFIDKIKDNGPDWFIGAREAKRLGLIKHIGIPVLETNISYEHNLKLK